MSKKDFIKSKLDFLKKDNQEVFKDLVEPLEQMADNGEISKTINIPTDGNWFTINFKAVQVKENRLVITAKRKQEGFVAPSYNPLEKEYVIEFVGTRAAYIRGFYKERHPLCGWPYIYWDVRSYANHPRDASTRVYVQGFYAHKEIKRLIQAMEQEYGTSNILNSYIQDNLLRFQMGIKTGKAPEEIERTWSKGMMESLGYRYVEAFDAGFPKGEWRDVKSHWCKKQHDLRPNL
jgi:hypothetical protein